jgi:hypothetical protein
MTFWEISGLRPYRSVGGLPNILLPLLAQPYAQIAIIFQSDEKYNNMKKLIIIPILFILAAAHAQSSVFGLQPAVSQRVYAGDSVQLFAILAGNGTVQGITWSQPAGQTITINPSTTLLASWPGGAVTSSSFWTNITTPGIYYFKAAGNINGTSGIVTDTLNLIASPAPRLVTSIALTIYGVPVIISASGLPAGAIKFNNGTVQ